MLSDPGAAEFGFVIVAAVVALGVIFFQFSRIAI